MTNRDSSPERFAQQEHARNLALEFQRNEEVLRPWKDIDPASPIIQPLRDRQTVIFGELWTIFQGPFKGIASSFVASLAASDETRQDALKSIALGVFVEILSERLPRLTIDPSKNFFCWMTTTAWKTLQKQAELDKHRHVALFSAVIAAGDVIVDPDSHQFVEIALQQDANTDLLAEIFRFWKHTLHPEDFKMMMLWLGGPIKLTPAQLAMLMGNTCTQEQVDQMADWFTGSGKRKSKEIAGLLGPGWSADIVRQRRSEIIRETKEHLLGKEYAEFPEIGDARPAPHMLALLADPRNEVQLQPLLADLKPLERRILNFYLGGNRALTYQEVVRELGPRWKVSKAREWVDQILAKACAYINECSHNASK